MMPEEVEEITLMEYDNYCRIKEYIPFEEFVQITQENETINSDKTS